MASNDQKQHAACDECRRRKIKCSGEPQGCSRCIQEGLTCRYSKQAPMGRPKKRRRDEQPQNGNLDFNFENDIAFDDSFNDFDFSAPTTFSNANTGINNDQIWHGVPWQGAASMDFSNVDISGIPPSAPMQSTFPWTNDQTASTIQPIHQPAETTSPNHVLQTTPLSQSNGTEICQCLINMSTFSSNMPADDNFRFPQSMGPLRFGMRKAQEILKCPKCNHATQSGTRRQNINFMLTILTALGCGFDQLLRHVDLEAKEASASGQKKSVTMGSMAPETAHLHTGTDDCPMRFDVQLDADEWRRVAFRAIKAEVTESDSDKLTLLGLVNVLEARQREWHAGMEYKADNGPDESLQQPKMLCVQLANNVRLMVDDMPA